ASAGKGRTGPAPIRICPCRATTPGTSTKTVSSSSRTESRFRRSCRFSRRIDMPTTATATAVSRPGVQPPFYRAVGDETEVFRAAACQGLPVLLKGPTGCGKTRFVEAMAHELGRPLITVAGHEDMTSADLV